MADWMNTVLSRFKDGKVSPPTNVTQELEESGLQNLPYGLAEGATQGLYIKKKIEEKQELVPSASWETEAPALAAEAESLGIGKPIAGRPGSIRTGATPEPREVSPFDFEDEANVNLNTRAKEAQTRKTGQGRTPLAGGFPIGGANVLYEDEENLAYKNDYGTLSSPSTTEKLGGFLPGMVYGYAKEATKPFTGEGAPVGEMPGVGLGETLAQSIAQAGNTQDFEESEVKEVKAEDPFEYIANMFSAGGTETKNLAKLPLTLATGLGNVYKAATERKRPAEERGLELAQGVRNLGGAVRDSAVNTFVSPLAMMEQAPLENIMNIAGVTAPLGSVLNKTGKTLQAGRQANLVEASELAKKFADGAQDAETAARKWRVDKSNLELQERILASDEAAALAGGQADAGLPFAARREALAKQRQELLADVPDVSGALGKLDVALDAVYKLREPTFWERLLTPEADRLAPLQAARTKVSGEAAQTGEAFTGRGTTNSSFVARQAEIAKLDKQIATSKRWQTLQSVAKAVPRTALTAGVNVAPELLTHVLARGMAQPGQAVTRWLLQLKTSTLPPEAQAIKREAAVLTRGDSLAVADVVAGIPPKQRPLVRDLLHADADNVAVVYNPKTKRWEIGDRPDAITQDVVDRYTRAGERFDIQGVPVPGVRDMAAREMVGNRFDADLATAGEHLRIANTYARPLAEMTAEAVRQASELGVKIPESVLQVTSGPGWFDLYPQASRTKLAKQMRDLPKGSKPLSESEWWAKQRTQPKEIKDTLLGRERDLAVEAMEGLAKLRFDIQQAKMYRELAKNPSLVMEESLFQRARAQNHYEKTGMTKVPESVLTDIDKQFIKVTDKDMGALSGKYVHEDVLMDIRMTREAVESAQTWYSKALGRLKRTLTQWNPGTHFRNVFTSGMVMAPMAGNALWDPKALPHYAQALKDLTGNKPSALYEQAVGDGVFAGNAALDMGGATSTKGTRYSPSKDLAGPPEGLRKEALAYLDDHFGGALGSPIEATQAMVALLTGERPAVMRKLSKEQKQMQASAAADLRGGFTGGAEARQARNLRRERYHIDLTTAVPKALAKLPGMLYNVEDDWFRLALYYRKLAEGWARNKAADFARLSYADYENVAGAVQILRTPTVLRTPAGGKVAGGSTAVVPFVLSQPFVAYPAAATRIYTQWAGANPLKAMTLTPLHHYFEGINYARLGMTPEQGRELAALGSFEGSPETDLLGAMIGPEVEEAIFGAAPDGALRTMDTNFFNPLGGFVPDARRTGDTGADTLGRYALQQGLGKNIVLSPAINMAAGTDAFGRPTNVGNSEGGDFRGRLNTGIQSYLPTVVPSASDFGDWLMDDEGQLPDQPNADKPRIKGGYGYEAINEDRLTATFVKSRLSKPAEGIHKRVESLNRLGRDNNRQITGIYKVPLEASSEAQTVWVSRMRPEVERLATQLQKVTDRADWALPRSMVLSYTDMLRTTEDPYAYAEIFKEMVSEMRKARAPEEE